MKGTESPIEGRSQGNNIWDFPKHWRRTPRGGYGYVERVPCRVIGTTKSGLSKIEALCRDGSTVIRYVRPGNVVDV